MRIRLALLGALIAGALGAADMDAQARPGAPADTVRLSPEEQLRQRQLQRLQQLSRPPGSDTVAPPADTTAPAPPRPLVPGGLPGLPALPARPGLDASGDTIVQRLLAGLPGHDPVQYQGAVVRFQAETRDLMLTADTATKAMVRYSDLEVTADSTIRYNQRTELVEATGNPTTILPGQEPVLSRRLLVDTRTQEASAFGAQTRTQEGGTTWHVEGDLNRIRSDMVFASHARFTSCTLTVPHYHFGAEHVKIIRGSLLVAAPAKLYFADVPVLWVPFIAQSLAQGRASGLLTPRFSVNDVVRSSGGYERRISNVGFYWAMSRYTDATLAMDWFSGNFTSLTAALRYRHLSRFLQGQLSARQFWRAEGGTEFSVNGTHAWQLSERTSMNASVAFVSSASFLRRNTFDPLEATQQISSSGGFTRRFDWGQLNLLANRSQSLSDERVDMTLPGATLSMKPITLFRAPANREAWFNNMTWSGSANLSRRTLDYPDPAEGQPFRFFRADQEQTRAAASQSLSLGNLSLSQSLNFQEGAFFGVPRDSIPFHPTAATGGVDVRDALLDWSMGLSYQQTLVGSTSITPNVTLSSSLLRSDTLELAQSFVAGPKRLSVGANLSSSLYGFFPGFGGFEAVRHRVSPSFGYQWAPEVEPTSLQRRVFRAQTLQPQSVLTVGLSQTFEAKRRVSADTAAPAPPPVPDTAAAQDPASPDAPRRREQGETVTLLSLHTSSLTYDFVQADSAGAFSQGFMSTRLRNEISSDYLRGLTLSVEHDLFHDSLISNAGERAVTDRRFSPHLAAVNMRFEINASSGIFRWLGIGPDSVASGEQGFQEEPLNPDDPFGSRRSVTDDASIIPGQRAPRQQRTQPGGGARRSDWRAGISYALTRPRGGGDDFGFNQASQNVRVSLQAQPTDLWRMSWSTSYDVEAGRFSDHMVDFTRDLHEWQAHFGFLKTATGNWQFRFEVELLDLPDLHFDFDQRSQDSGGRIPPG